MSLRALTALTDGERELADLLWRRVEEAAARLHLPLGPLLFDGQGDHLARWFAQLGVLAPDEAAWLVSVTPIKPPMQLRWCGCGAPVEDEHPCPYKSEIHDDHTTLCQCCEDCERECHNNV